MVITGLVIGALLGIIMQRSRFCVTNMIRDVYLARSWRAFTALLILISIHSLGLAALTSAGVIQPEYSTFAPIALTVGSITFGIGIVLAGGCASGTWYRSGEGLVGSWVALIFYALSAAAMKTGPLTGFNSALKAWDTGWTTLPEATGISPWFFAVALTIGTAVLARHFLNKERGVAKARLNQAAWKQPIHLYAAAVIIGVIATVAWPLSAATGRNYGLGITGPSSNLANYVVTGDPERFDWGVLLVLGILLGSFVAAKAVGEFRVRVPDATQIKRSVVGGIMMGVGASLAGGCTVGNGMVETSLFSFQGWYSLAGFFVGIGIAAKIWLKPSKRISAEDKVLGDATSADAVSADTTPAAVDVAPVDAAPAGAAPADAAPSFGDFAVASGVITLNKPAKIAGEGVAKDGIAKGGKRKSTQVADHLYKLDTMGAVCPFPLIEAKDAMTELEVGEELLIDFDCTQATDSIPQWAADNGHEVTEFVQNDDAGWQITVKKGA